MRRDNRSKGEPWCFLNTNLTCEGQHGDHEVIEKQHGAHGEQHSAHIGQHGTLKCISLVLIEVKSIAFHLQKLNLQFRAVQICSAC